MSGFVRLLGALALAASLAGCGSIGGDKPAPQQTLVPAEAPKVAPAPPTAVTEEQQRIAGAYGGIYLKPNLTTFLNGIADRLATASERPDLRYKVVMLNSPLVNAFALPNGNLYVTRGLLAVANDSSELAAVIAHEMAHVSARHAIQRADEERKAVLVSRIVSDVLQDSQGGAVALARGKLSLASFSRAPTTRPSSRP
ncbi:MAG: M48 family metalloprotease [Hansschlegelia sp.]